MAASSTTRRRKPRRPALPPTWWVAAAAVAAVWLRYGTAGLIGLAVIAAAGAAAVRRWRRRSGRFGDYRDQYDRGNVARGQAAEDEVAAAAAKVHGVRRVVRNIDLGHGDVDMLVIAREIFAVEVKAGGGAVHWDGQQLVTAAGRVVHGTPNPVAQAARQAQLAERAAGRPVRPVVCIPGMRNQLLVHCGSVSVPVVGTADLAALVADGRPMSPREVDRVVARVEKAQRRRR